MRREAHRTRVACHVRKAQRLVLADHDPEQTLALGQPADALGLLLREPGVNELGELAVLIHETDRRVARADEGREGADRLAQQVFLNLVDREQADELQRGAVELIEPLRGQALRRHVQTPVAILHAGHARNTRVVGIVMSVSQRSPGHGDPARRQMRRGTGPTGNGRLVSV